MELLERYLNQIEKYLPLKDREDTIKELRSLILEELDSRTNGSNDEAALYDIIQEYGFPIEVAHRYRNDTPLISAELKPFLILVLKIVTFAVTLGLLIASIVDIVFNGEGFTFMDLLLKIAFTIPAIINALLFTYAFVILGFILIDKYAKPAIVKEIPKFEPKTLPKIIPNANKISLFEILITIFGSIVFLYIINFQPGIISVYTDGNSYPLLNDNFTALLPLVNLGALFGLTIALVHLAKRKRTKLTAMFELTQTIYTSVLMILLATGDIFNQLVIQGHSLDFIPAIFRVVMFIVAPLSFIGGLVKYIKFLLAKKE